MQSMLRHVERLRVAASTPARLHASLCPLLCPRIRVPLAVSLPLTTSRSAFPLGPNLRSPAPNRDPQVSFRKQSDRSQIPQHLARSSGLRFLSSDESHAEWEAAKAAIKGAGYASLQEVLDLVEEKKATDVKVLSASEIEKLGEICEHMVIVTCLGQRHMRVVAEHVSEHYKLKGMLLESEGEDNNVAMRPPKPEGPDSDEWILLDLRNVVLHIFSPEGRQRYALEAHWAKIAAGGYTEEEIERMKEEGPDYIEGSSEADLMK